MSKQKTSVKEKVQKQFPDFVNEVAGLSKADLEGRILTLAKALAEVEKSQEDDEELEAAQEEVSLLRAPYQDAKKAIKLKTRFILGMLSEKEEA